VDSSQRFVGWCPWFHAPDRSEVRREPGSKSKIRRRLLQLGLLMERSNDRFARDGDDAVCGKFARACCTPRQSRANNRSETQSLFPCPHRARAMPIAQREPNCVEIHWEWFTIGPGGRPVRQVHMAQGRASYRKLGSHCFRKPSTLKYREGR
jgi:hypothetical protein